MRWLFALPLIPMLLCGGVCLGGVLVAFLVGRRSTERSDPARNEPQHEEVS